MQRKCKRGIKTDPPMPFTISIIREKFKEDRTVQNVQKPHSRRPRSRKTIGETLVNI